MQTSWLSKDRKRIDGVIKDLKIWLGESDRRRSAIIGIGGKYDHWSCVSMGFDRRIIFDDSDGGIRISIANIAAGASVNKTYLIKPEDVLGIEINLINE